MRGSIVAKLVFALFLLLGAEHAQAQSSGRITGTVVTARADLPVPGVVVVVAGTLHAGVTDADGRFTIEAIAPGAYTVEVNALGYRPERATVDVAAGTTSAVDFQLRLPEVEVEQLEEDALHHVLMPMSALDTARLREMHVQTTAALLRVLPGSDAARRGALDVEPTIRGLWGNQIGVYVDGGRFLAGSPYGFGAALSPFDPHAVSHVEVIKGPYALTWGGGNLGAIRIEPQDAVPAGTRLRGEVLAGYTSRLNALEAAGSSAGSIGKAAYRLHGTFQTGNDYTSGAGRAVPHDFQASTVRGRVDYRFAPSTRLVLHAGYQDRRDLDAPGAGFETGASETADVSARFQTAWGIGPLRELDASVYWNRRLQALDDGFVAVDFADVDLVSVQKVPVLAFDAEQYQFGGRLAATLAPADGWIVEVGGDAYSVLHNATRTVEAETTAQVEPVLQDARLTDAGAFVSGTHTFGRIEAMAAVRTDVVRADAPGNDRRTDVDLSGAVSMVVEVSTVWQVTAGVGSVARTADAYERFAAQAPFRRALHLAAVQGRPGLSPERSTQGDLSLHGSFSRLDLTLDAFVRRVQDYITPRRQVGEDPPVMNTAAWQYDNGSATFYGVAGRAMYALFGEYVTLNGGASYLWGRDEEREEPLPGITPAVVEGGGRLTAPANFFFVEGMLRGAFKQTQVSPHYGEVPTAGYITADLRLGVSLPHATSLLLGVDNLTNTAYANHLNALYPGTTVRLPEPGRVFYARLRVAF